MISRTGRHLLITLVIVTFTATPASGQDTGATPVHLPVVAGSASSLTAPPPTASRDSQSEVSSAAISPHLLANITAISTGQAHTCALTATGGVKCWGYNGSGQMGDGTTTDRLMPVDVVGLASGVQAIQAGDFHTCALTAAGGVKCWGYNEWGQLGDGTTTAPGSYQLTPVEVFGLTGGVVAISGGGNHTCALTTAGGVKCWGVNTWGQLGDGTAGQWNLQVTPVDVIGLTSGVAAISAGSVHTCALTTAGGVKCWGYNEWGQLGDGTQDGWQNPDIRHLVPVDVVGLTSGVLAVEAGHTHTCALTTAGGFKCWGNNSNGGLGDGGGGQDVEQLSPVDVSGLTSGVQAGSVGHNYTCALMTTGGVKCWGANDICQLGDDTTIESFTPVDVVGLESGVAAISAGQVHTCALTTAGGVKCWGLNSIGMYRTRGGQLGDGTLTQRCTPVDVLVPAPPTVRIASVTNDGPIDEGGSANITVVADDPAGNLDPLRFWFDCDGDDHYEVGPQLLNSYACPFADDGTFAVNVKLTDGNGGEDIDATAVMVNNLPPRVEPIVVAPADLLQVDTTFATSAQFSDRGVLDTHTAMWEWGDGTTTPGTVTEANGSGSVNGGHSYGAPGVYTIVLTVTDNAGESGIAAYQFVVVYDPLAGFVTGGGWIDSPPGACRYAACTADTIGRANFGFVAKYQKGANVPMGHTEFQFKAGNLNFHSSSYGWLVVAGARAKFKGVGTINGVGSFGFMLTAIDGQLQGGGGVDKFRIKIWDMTSGDAIVYDNQMEIADDEDPTTVLGGGNIVIHKQGGSANGASMSEDPGSVETSTTSFLPLLFR